MAPTFRFTVFKGVMAINDIDEPTYAFILRSIFDYIKSFYGLALDSTIELTSLEATTTTAVLPLDTNIVAGQTITSGNEESRITSVSNGTYSTITYYPAFTLAPTLVSINTIILTYDLQYAIFKHAKFIFENQKRLTNTIDSVSDNNGNKVSYKVQPTKDITNVYLAYAKSPIAFI
jgi:hypothetical protein